MEMQEEKIVRYEAALRKIQNITQQIYQASLNAELEGRELDASTFAFALGACLGQVEEALGEKEEL